ncbi:hypothetical protein [Pseudomonas nicosulfuronedens]
MTKLYIETLGIRINAANIPAIAALTVMLLSICGTVAYLVTKSDSVSQVISSFGGLKPADQAAEDVPQEVLEFFIPAGPGYEAGRKDFERWLTEQSDWWGRTPMTSLSESKADTLEGYQYSLTGPKKDSPLTIDTSKAISSQAIKFLGTRNIDDIWMRVVSLPPR